MRLILASLLVGAAVVGLSAFGPLTGGKEPAVHQMTVQLPGGGTETIRYTGNVAPKIRFVETPFTIAWPSFDAFGVMPSFAAFDQIEADMDRQMDALFRNAQSMANGPLGTDFTQAALQNLGSGGSAYTVMSENVGGNVCTRMTEITSSPNGGKPKVVSRASGNCGGSSSAAAAPHDTPGVRSIADHQMTPESVDSRAAL